MGDLRIVDATTPDELVAVRRLCWDYLDFLKSMGGVDAQVVTFAYPEEKYAQLMEQLAEIHAPPGGAIKLALKGRTPVGCGMFHTLDDGVAEIKRVYVTNDARGLGAGRALMDSLIDSIRAGGFQTIRMDTGILLHAAKALYLSMGFRLRGPYAPVPDFARDRMLFFEMDLD